MLVLGEAAAAPGPQPSSTGQRGCAGKLPQAVVPLTEVGIAAHDWLPLVGRFGRLFHSVAGAPGSLSQLRTSWRFRRGRNSSAAEDHLHATLF